MSNKELAVLYEAYYGLVEQAAQLDELYEMLGVLPSQPRVLHYASMYWNTYKAIAVSVNGEPDKYALKVAEETTRRYLTDEYERVGRILQNPQTARPKAPANYDGMLHIKWDRWKEKAENPESE